MNGRPEASRRVRRSSAVSPARLAATGGAASTIAVATARPNEAMPARSTSSSLRRCLNRASSRHRNRGCSLSSSNEPGSRPSRRATPNLSSARADGEASASELHHRGHAASIAGSESPRSFSRDRSWAALSMFDPLDVSPIPATAFVTPRSAPRVLLHDARNRPRYHAQRQRRPRGHRRQLPAVVECICIAGGTPSPFASASGEALGRPSPD